MMENSLQQIVNGKFNIMLTHIDEISFYDFGHFKKNPLKYTWEEMLKCKREKELYKENIEYFEMHLNEALYDYGDLGDCLCMDVNDSLMNTKYKNSELLIKFLRDYTKKNMKNHKDYVKIMKNLILWNAYISGIHRLFNYEGSLISESVNSYEGSNRNNNQLTIILGEV